MTGYEVNQFKEKISEMTKEQQTVIAEALPNEVLTLEVFRRLTEQETIINEIKSNLERLGKEQ